MFREVDGRNGRCPRTNPAISWREPSPGVLATVGEDGWPYAVPLNHVLAGDVLYVHGATEGHKLDNIAHEARMSCTAPWPARR